MVPAEVLVLGGGPAGCAAARLLALWGHDVVLVAKPPLAGPFLPESIPPSTSKLFELLGVRDRIDAAGFVRSTGHTVWWGSETARIERFPAGALGWQVSANQVEPILQAAAADAGARLEQGRVTAEEATGRDAAFILDCTGRAGVMARARGWRTSEPGYRTVALVGRWRPRTVFDLSDPTHTLIESYADGWAWSVPDADGCRYVAAMVDPRRSNLSEERSARDIYQAEIAKTRRLSGLVQDAMLLERPSGWDASMYFATHYADERVLLVGDAGSFIDPLSSVGVKKALASAWLAAVATHTALVRPAMRDTALAFFSTREAEIYTAFRTRTAQFLAEAADGHENPFWADRIDPFARAAEDEEPQRAAFERIRRAESLSLRAAPGVRVESRPAVSACEIVLEARAVSDEHASGVRYVFDVDLLALIELAPSYDQVPDLFDAYNRQRPPVALPDFLMALATAVADGWLVWASDTAP